MSFPSKFAHPGTFPATPFLICAVLLVTVAGCNSCFVGVSNPTNNSPIVPVGNGNLLPACRYLLQRLPSKPSLTWLRRVLAVLLRSR
jgi:hypothetical protein